MADSKISGLAAVAAFVGTQEFGVNDSGTSRKITGTQIVAAVAQGTGNSSGGYSQVTSNVSGVTAQVDLGPSVSFTAVAGRRYRISGQCAAIISTVANDVGELVITDGANNQQNAYQTPPLPTANGPGAIVLAVVVPGAGAITYKLRGARGTGTGSLTFSGAATTATFILVEDIGV